MLFRNRLSFDTDEERSVYVLRSSFFLFLPLAEYMGVCLRTRREESRRGDFGRRSPMMCIRVLNAVRVCACAVFKNRKDSTPCDMLSRAYSRLSLLLTAFYSNQHAKMKKSLNYAHSFFSTRGLFGILLFLIGRETRPRHNGVSYFAGSLKENAFV